MNLNNNELITIGDKDRADKVIFWFHGYGSNNWSFEPTMKTISMYLNSDVFIVMPNAPIVDNKRSWYPLPKSSENGNIVEDDIGLNKSKKIIYQFIESLKIRDNQKIIIGGFSQGAALSLSMLFNINLNIYGCIALSGYMPSANYYKNSVISPSNIFMAHGYSDQAISFKDYEKTYEFLKKRTKKITTYTADFGHTVTKGVNDKIIEWLNE